MPWRQGHLQTTARTSADGALRILYAEQARAAAAEAAADSVDIDKLRKTVPSIPKADPDVAAAKAAADDADELLEDSKTATGSVLAHITRKLIAKRDAAEKAAKRVADALEMAEATSGNALPAYDTFSSDMSMASGKIQVERESDGTVSGYDVMGTRVSAAISTTLDKYMLETGLGSDNSSGAIGKILADSDSDTTPKTVVVAITHASKTTFENQPYRNVNLVHWGRARAQDDRMAAGGTAIFEAPNAEAADIPSVGSATYSGLSVYRYYQVREENGAVKRIYHHPTNGHFDTNPNLGGTTIVDANGHDSDAMGGNGQGGSAYTNAELVADFADGTVDFDTKHTTSTDQGGSLKINDISIVSGELKVGSKTRITGGRTAFMFEVRQDDLDGQTDSRETDIFQWSTNPAILEKTTVSVDGRFYGNSEVGFTYRAVYSGALDNPTNEAAKAQLGHRRGRRFHRHDPNQVAFETSA